MGWGAAQIALAIAGALFLVGVVASLHPRLSLSLASRVMLSAAAGVYLAAAVAVQGSVSPSYVPLVWLVSVLLVVVVVRDGIRHGTPQRSPFSPLGEVAVARPAETEIRSSTRAAPVLDPAASSAELEELAYTSPEARSAVAAHAATPASVLSWLALHGDEAVVAAITERQEPGDATGSDR